MDRDSVRGMKRRLGGRLNGAPDVKAIVVPPFLNSEPPLYEGGEGGKFNTVAGYTQTDKRVDGRWCKNPACPRSKVWIVYENGRACKCLAHTPFFYWRCATAATS